MAKRKKLYGAAAKAAARKRAGRKAAATRKRNAAKRSAAARKAARSRRTTTRRATPKRKTTARRRTTTRRATTKRRTTRRRSRSMSSPKKIGPALKQAVPVALGAGAGIIAPRAVQQGIAQLAPGLSSNLASPAVSYAVDGLATFAGWWLLTNKGSGKLKKAALPFLAGGALQLTGRILREQAPQVAQSMGIGAQAFPTPYGGMGLVRTMGGVGAVRTLPGYHGGRMGLVRSVA